jgi:hypothetical protein
VEKVLFQSRNESRTTLPAKIKGRHDDHLVQVDLCLTEPDAAQREFALLGGDAPKPC